MKLESIVAVLILSGLITRPSWSQETCSLSDKELARVESLREAMGVVSLVVGPEDAPTGIGLGVIDESCLTEGHAAYRGETISAIQSALLRAIEQAEICYERMRVIEMPDVASVLRRTRFRCMDPDGSGLVAQMRRTSRVYDHCGNPTARYMAMAHRRYEMTLSAPVAGVSDKINATASTRLNTEELASFLAHEAMHVLAMNNRDWHNTFTSEERPTRGCDPSLFADRIYFTQAVCFPQSDYGREFYAEGGAYECTDLCLSALTEIDPDAAVMFSASTEPGAEATTAFGPSQVARPYPAEEARRLCERIRTSRGLDL
jgi:hypothetical protein